MFVEIINSIRKNKPLVHCITNPISINFCANGILALGGRAIMAEHPGEVEEITSTANALVLNLGNITDVRMESMALSLKTANKKNIPVVLDAVGVSCSELRRDFAFKLLENKITLLKGNYSEIMALWDPLYISAGVDSQFDGDICKAASELSKKYKCAVLASGKTDVVTYDNKTFGVKNGSPQLAAVTGTGCLLGALCGCCLSVSADIYGVLSACGVLGICGEHAETKIGNGTFSVRLIDELSSDLKEEEFIIEKF